MNLVIGLHCQDGCIFIFLRQFSVSFSRPGLLCLSEEAEKSMMSNVFESVIMKPYPYEYAGS